MHWILVAQSAAVWLMVGLTWALQRFSYPLLSQIPQHQFGRYQTAFNKRLPLTMLPGVGVAALTTVMMFLRRPPEMPIQFPIAAAVFLALITGSAAIHAAPAHRKLAQGFDFKEHKLLLSTNWFRLTAWVLFGALDLYLLIRYF